MSDESIEGKIKAHNEAHAKKFGLHDIDEDMVVDKYEIETYYAQWTDFCMFDGDDFVRVVVDNGGVDFEIRLHRETIKEMLEMLDAPPENHSGESGELTESADKPQR